MQKLILPFALVTSLFLFGCGNQAEQSHNHDHDDHAHEEDSHNEHMDHELKAMSLNNGVKWEMQPELMVNVGNMESIIDSVNNLESKDYAQIATELESETTNLINGCTMKGDSHNELHKWLEPHLAMVKDLKATTSADEAEAILSEIYASFTMLREYFE